jgi:site-specific recombinase XerD
LQIYFFSREHVRDIQRKAVTTPRDGTPFLMDGAEPVALVNKWLLALPRLGVHSKNTWRIYAYSMVGWVTYLRANGRSIDDDPKEFSDLFVDYRWERLTGEGEFELKVITGNSWNTMLAGINSFYDWANEARLVSGYPYDFRRAQVSLPGGGSLEVRSSKMSVRTGRRNVTVKSLTQEYADTFVTVGMGGRLPDGTHDPTFAGRNGARNLTVARMLLSTGLRIQELANLLVWELPNMGSQSAAEPVFLKVAAPIAKGLKPRTTWIEARDLSEVQSYVNIERQLATKSSRWKPAEGAALHVTDIGHDGGVVNGKFRRWSSLSKEDRQRLVAPDGGSAMLFVQRGGGPLIDDGIREVFRAASRRCQQFDANFPHVHPHVMRHSFAVLTLQRLGVAQLGRLAKLARLVDGDPRIMATLGSKNPLMIVRDLLGHSSVATTQIYLDLVDPSKFVTDAEIELLLAEDDLVRES